MHHKRAIIKAVEWEIVSNGVGWTLIYFSTGEFVLATGITLLSIPVKIVAYYLHEEFWEWMKWDK